MPRSMLATKIPSRAVCLLGASVVVMVTACATEPRPEPTASADSATSVQLGKLGTVEFPTTCSAEAQPRFLRGVAALHSFWYPVALDEFRAATRIDPPCMMGYWGEAMTHNHPIWGDPQETEDAREVIRKISITPELTPKERAWLDAVKILYGEGDKAARDNAYAAAMDTIYRDYPDDAEAALFYALALMGSGRSDDPAGQQARLRAGAIASSMFEKKPDHPGAAHYVIHAYDDPEHAGLALGAARRYADIAPAAPHALHMPSHIFLQLGMWPEAAASNEAAWAASKEWGKRRNLPIDERDYHSLRWLMYVYLQQGRYDNAKDLLVLMRESLPQFPTDDPYDLMYGTFTHAAMAATFVVETERWHAADQWLPHANVWEDHTQSGRGSTPKQLDVIAHLPAIFAQGLAAAVNNAPAVKQSLAAMSTIQEQASDAMDPFVAGLIRVTEIQELEIDAVAAASQNRFDDAIAMMQKATASEDASPPSGPPSVIKPAHELFGEILLRAGRPKDAADQFAMSLRRHTNRARSLLGAARAAAQSGDGKGAATLYAQFARQWEQGDAELPELREARNYGLQAEAH